MGKLKSILPIGPRPSIICTFLSIMYLTTPDSNYFLFTVWQNFNKWQVNINTCAYIIITIIRFVQCSTATRLLTSRISYKTNLEIFLVLGVNKNLKNSIPTTILIVRCYKYFTGAITVHFFESDFKTVSASYNIIILQISYNIIMLPAVED